MPDQKNDQTAAQDYLGLGPELVAAWDTRPLTAREVIQWLCACQERATDLNQLQLIADYGTGAIRAMYLCWLISLAESETMVAQINAVYHVKYREISGAIIH